MNVAQTELRLAVLAELRKTAEARYAAAQEPATAEKRALSAAEAEALTAIRGEVDQIDAEVVEKRALLADLRQAEADAAAGAPEGRADTDEAEERAAAAAESRRRVGGAVVAREKRTYEKWDPHASYLRDLIAAHTQTPGKVDPSEARARLDRHRAEVDVELPKIEARAALAKGGYATEVREAGEREAAEILYMRSQEQRALTRVDGSGGDFVPPIYIMDEWVNLVRAGRVTANLCNNMPLPGGTDSINLPRVSTGTTTAIQTADNAAVSSTDLAAATVTASVRTIAGQQDIALQLLDQSPLNFDQIVFADLAADYAQKLDVQVLAGTNASGQVLGMQGTGAFQSTTYVDATPTVPELYSKMAGAASQFVTGRYDMPTAIIMHPRRWYWWLAALDSTNRPLSVVSAEGPYNALAQSTPGATAQGYAGVTAFGPVFLDPNISILQGAGTEDSILYSRPQEMYLWEGNVRTRVLPDVGSGTLTVRLQLFNYVAFMPNRRGNLNTVAITGTGLIPPTF